MQAHSCVTHGIAENVRIDFEKITTCTQIS